MKHFKFKALAVAVAAALGFQLGTAPTTIMSMSGAKIYISATRPETNDAAGYQSTDLVFTEIGEVEQFGAHGVKANVIKFTNVGDANVQKVKGSKDYGSGQYTVGMVSGDAGQVIVKAASESQNRYSIKLVYPTGTGLTPETHYFDALVSEFTYQDGTVDTVAKVQFMLEICRIPVVVSAT